VSTAPVTATGAHRSASTPSPRRQAALAGRQGRAGQLLVLPALVLVIVFVLFPLGFALYISLTDWPLIGSARFVGIDNYTALFSDVAFGRSILFTLLYTAIVTVPIFVLGYLLAMFVRTKRRGAVLFRTLLFLPYVVGLTAVSFVLVLELQPGTGVINFLLAKAHVTDGQTAWLVSTGPAILITCLLVVWFASGLTMLLLMGGMQGIPKDVYESAEVDGAGFWARELQITVPLLRRTIALSLILSVIGSFLAFNQFYILTQGGPGSSTTTVLYAIYNRAFVQLRLGSATAQSVVLVLVIAAVTALQFRVLREDTGDSRRIRRRARRTT
jgi:multiple sugar transport system permease protein